YEHLYDEVIKVKDGEDYDETVLRYIGKLSKCHLPKEEREIFKTFLRDIEALEKKLRVACGQKEVKRWVRSKLSGRPMADLLREESKS
ncbi:MAG: hypothetical protein KDD09_26465, partial [Phaeodactylibacter sp.]|nr:hypothetical protein [Phaeodactylibacter sp.]